MYAENKLWQNFQYVDIGSLRCFHSTTILFNSLSNFSMTIIGRGIWLGLGDSFKVSISFTIFGWFNLLSILTSSLINCVCIISFKVFNLLIQIIRYFRCEAYFTTISSPPIVPSRTIPKVPGLKLKTNQTSYYVQQYLLQLHPWNKSLHSLQCTQ